MASPAFLHAPQSLNHHHRINPLSHINLSTSKSHISQKFSQHFIDSDCACLFPSQIIRRSTNSSSLKASPDSATIVDDSPAAAAASLYSEEDDKAVGKIGARVRVKVPLKVYHIPKVQEVELNGMEGVLKQYVAVWKGKRISANFPFKVGFVSEIEGRDGLVKFFAHLKDEEFEFLD